MHNRMLARVPKGLRPKQRLRVVIRCPWTGRLARETKVVVIMDDPMPYGQGGRSFEVEAQAYM